jgi:hypothetical protein
MSVDRFFLCRQCGTFEPYDGKTFNSCSKCDLSSFLDKYEDQTEKSQSISPTHKKIKVEGYTYKKSINFKICPILK